VVNVKSTMARLGLGLSPPPPNRGNDIEYIAWFRFPVTWTYLSNTAAAEAPLGPPVKSLPSLAPPVMTLVSAAPALAVVDTTLTVGDTRSAGSAAQWEMVIPKMARPPAKRVEDRLPAPLPPTAIPPATLDQNNDATIDFTPPSLLQFAPDDAFLVRFWKHIALAAVALLIVGFLLWGTSGNEAAVQKPPAEWSHRYASPPGRLLSLYEPSRQEADYSLEFSWVPDKKGVGWVLRVRDEDNYDAARLTLQQPAPNMALAEDHFSVVAGVESAHSRKLIPLGNQSGPVQIQMDAIGSAFTLSLQAKPVDYWAEARVNPGALGFFDENGDRPDVKGLRFTFIKKGATRTAVASLP